MAQLHGIDCSHWQSGLNLASTDAQFVLAKATDSTNFVDSTCDHWVSSARKMGIPWGVYHFYQGNPTAEADFFVDQVRGYVGAGMLVLDFETHTSDVAGAKAWLDRVYAKTGVRPLIYMSQSVAAGHNWSSVMKDYALWVARYNESIGSTGGWPVTMWQYTDAHHTGGYSVDGDYFYGTKSTWAALAGGSEPAPDPDPGPDPDDGAEDDMPSWKNLTNPDDRDLVADGAWHTLSMDKGEDGSNFYSVLTGPAFASGTLHVALAGLTKGHEVNTRFVLVDVAAGHDTKIVGEGSTFEQFAQSSSMALTMPFASYVTDGPYDWTRKLRFQIRAYGGEKITIQGTRVRLLYWVK